MNRSIRKVVATPLLLTLCFAAASCSEPSKLTNNVSDKQRINTPILSSQLKFSISNPRDFSRTEESISLSKLWLNTLVNDFNFNAFTVWDGTKEIPSQAGDANGDGISDQLIFNTKLSALERKNFTLKYSPTGSLSHTYPKRTHTELAVRLVDGNYQDGIFTSVAFQQLPKNYKIGDGLFKYEGPGWESDKIAYRLYFDQRNVIDIFGKKNASIVLPEVGQPGGNYHKEADWGMDILKVGDSLGMGGIGMYSEGKVYRVDSAQDMSVAILEDGPLQSHLQIKHSNWALAGQDYNLTSDMTINAGSRLTHNSLNISSKAKNLVTGLVKHPSAQLINSGQNNGEWSYMATFGKQSIIGDELGMAIFYHKSSLIELTDDKKNHLVVMKPENGQLDYYFLATWAQDTDGITTEISFKTYLNQTLKQLNWPLLIEAIK